MKVQNRMAGLAINMMSCDKKLKTDMLTGFASYQCIIFI
jgi:hypothetical protein